MGLVEHNGHYILPESSYEAFRTSMINGYNDSLAEYNKTAKEKVVGFEAEADAQELVMPAMKWAFDPDSHSMTWTAVSSFMGICTQPGDLIKHFYKEMHAIDWQPGTGGALVECLDGQSFLLSCIGPAGPDVIVEVLGHPVKWNEDGEVIGLDYTRNYDSSEYEEPDSFDDAWSESAVEMKPA